LQDALAAADANDEIRVAQGTYVPDRSIAHPNGNGDRNATFHLINGASIRGGYAGLGEPDPDMRDIVAYETVLSGDLAGDDGPDFLNNDENSYHVVTGSETDANAVLDGFVIIGGNANGAKPNDRGAGMYNYEGGPTVTNCTFSGNYAKVKGGGMFNGAEDYDEDEPPPPGYVSSRVVVIGCVFNGNIAGFQDDHSNGAGMCNNCYSAPTLIDCVFSENTVGNDNGRGRGGGMHNYEYSNASITDCVFKGNSAGQDGGGISNDEKSVSVLAGCKFIDNRANSDGGGIFGNDLSRLRVTHCTFSGNSAWAGGGTYNRRLISAEYVNCVFSGNSATAFWGGGGMFSHHGHVVLTNCTFTGNSAPNGPGGGICNDWINGSTLTNCIFWDNIADEGPQIALTNTWASDATSVDYSAIQGGEVDIFIQDALLEWGEGNIGEDLINHDPRFVKPGFGGRGTWIEGDYHLRWDSPCINAGDGGGDYLNMVDLDGEPRVMGGRVDMGADEVGEKQADLTRDGIINFEDFSIFSQSWPENVPDDEWYVLCNLYEDEKIDAMDMAEFVSDWLWEADWYEP
jgi:hypothetical protein